MNEKMQEILCQRSVGNIGEGGTPTAGITTLLRKATSSDSQPSTMRGGKKGAARKPGGGWVGLARPGSSLMLGFLAFRTVD